MEHTGLGQAEVTLNQTCCSWHQGTSSRRRAALDLRPGEDVTTGLEGTSSFLLPKGHAGYPPVDLDAVLMREAREAELYERFNPFIQGD